MRSSLSHSSRSTPITHRLASQAIHHKVHQSHASSCQSKVIHHKVHPSHIGMAVKSHSPQSTPITPRLASQKSFTTKYTHHTSACRSSHSRKCTHHTSALQTSRSPQSTPITDRPANLAIPESTTITHFILPCHHKVHPSQIGLPIKPFPKVHPSHTTSCHAAPMPAEIAQGRILFKRRTSILTFLAFSSVRGRG